MIDLARPDSTWDSAPMSYQIESWTLHSFSHHVWVCSKMLMYITLVGNVVLFVLPWKCWKLKTTPYMIRDVMAISNNKNPKKSRKSGQAELRPGQSLNEGSTAIKTWNLSNLRALKVIFSIKQKPFFIHTSILTPLYNTKYFVQGICMNHKNNQFHY